MDIREAILKAANQIERHPETFEFFSFDKPGCGTPGCALGWIGAFMNFRHDSVSYAADTAEQVLGIQEGDFYTRMHTVLGGGKLDDRWTDDAAMCAWTLRGYADAYHPAAPRDAIPSSVRAIFEPVQESVS
jgi:hypothetical protein